MKIQVQCPRCQTRYGVEMAQLASETTRLVCKSCGHRWKPALPRRRGQTAPPAPRDAVCPQCGHTFPFDPTAARSRSMRRILVVEDQEYFAEVAQDALGKDFEVTAVRTPTAAIQEISRRSPDLLILDLTLADGGDGREVLRSVPKPGFPVLIFTSTDEQEMYGPAWAELQELGANDLLIKGINFAEDLQRKVKNLLKPSA